MISSKLLINGVEFHNSPTTTLRSDVVTELGDGTATISKINSIELVDPNGNVIATLTATVSRSGNQITVTASWTNNTGSDKTVAKIRTKAGTKVYFESSVSYTVPNGSTLNVTVTITVSLTSTDSDFAGGVLDQEIAKRLTGETTSAVYPTNVDLLEYSDVENQYVIAMRLNVSRSKDLTNYVVTVTASGTATTTYYVSYIGLVLSTVSPIPSQPANYGLMWSKGINIPSGAQVTLTFTISV